MRGKFPGEALTEIEVPRNQYTGRDAEITGRRRPRLIRCANSETGKVAENLKCEELREDRDSATCPVRQQMREEIPRKRRVLTTRQVCVNTRKSSGGSGSIKISKTASDKVTTGALSRYGECSPW